MAELTKKERATARDIAVSAALLGLRNAPAIHYTQGSRRWDGIRMKLYSVRRKFPFYADCSAFVTWCLWNAMAVAFRRIDSVNGARWKAGYTGTLISHGKPIRHLKNVIKADVVIYGSGPAANQTKHTAMVVGRKNGVPMVVSHGSEGGPYLLPYNYRSDIVSIRRYIRRGI